MRFRIRTGLLILAIVALALTITLKNQLFEIETFDQVTSADQWPQPLNDFIMAASHRELDISHQKLYKTNQVDYFLSAEAGEDVFDLMQETWSLRRVDKDHPIASRFVRKVPNNFASKALEGGTVYLSENWLSGDEGDMYLVVYDQKSKNVAVWYYFNF